MSMCSASEMRSPSSPKQTGKGLVDDAAGGALGDERAQLHAVEAEGGRFGVDLRTADVLRRRVLDGSVDDGEAVEAGHGGQAWCRGQAALLHGAGVQLDWPPLAANTSSSHWAHQAKNWRRSVV